jgi:asparagine synthase (glutamine-hydrolysing)
MCGIAGTARASRTPAPPIARGTIEAMTEIVRHRGPNDVGYFLDDGVALGVRRLSIIDVEGGHQPFASESGDVVAI